jgi:hypothetical protein
MRALLFSLALLAALPLAAVDSKNLLNGHEDYFESGRLENGMVKAEATEAFEKLNSARRNVEIILLMQDLDQSLEDLEGPLLLRIGEGAAGSLWVLPEGARRPIQFESWDRNKDLGAPDSRTGRWFSYVGLGMVLSVPKDSDSLSLGLNGGVKVGTFLFKNIVDFGVSVGLNDNLSVSTYSTDSSYSYNLGLFSRVHFPLIGRLGGNVGGEGNLTGTITNSDSTDFSGKSTTNASSSYSSGGAFLAGLSFFLPSGSIDFDVRFGTATTCNIGFTTFIGGSPSGKASPPAAKSD